MTANIDPNHCPYCEYRHPVATMVTLHVNKDHQEQEGATHA